MSGSRFADSTSLPGSRAESCSLFSPSLDIHGYAPSARYTRGRFYLRATSLASVPPVLLLLLLSLLLAGFSLSPRHTLRAKTHTGDTTSHRGIGRARTCVSRATSFREENRQGNRSGPRRTIHRVGGLWGWDNRRNFRMDWVTGVGEPEE